MADGSKRGHRPTRDPLVVDHAERLAGLGSWEWTPATGELAWSENCFRLHGLAVDAIVPSTDFLVQHVHPDDLEALVAMLEALRAGEPRSVEYRFRRDDDELAWFRATVALIGESAEGNLRIIGSVQDVTTQRRLEREVAARVGVTEALDGWRTLELSAAELLAGIARIMGFVLGALWIRDGNHFAVQGVWHVASPELEWVAEATKRWRPGPGSPTIGRAFTMRQPMLVGDVSASAPRGLAMAIRQAGIKGALTVPAVFEHETVAVLEFLSFEPAALTDHQSRALYGMGHEIGHFLAGRRSEFPGSALSPRAVEVLQLASHGFGTEEIGTQLGLSSATIKRHFERAGLQLGVSGRVAAVAEAMRRGLIS